MCRWNLSFWALPLLTACADHKLKINLGIIVFGRNSDEIFEFLPLIEV